jgi:hypothetical protein
VGQPESERRFELETLEQRIMLSADPLVGALAAWQLDREDPLAQQGDSGFLPAEKVFLTADESAFLQSVVDSPVRQFSQDSTDILAGLAEVDLRGETAGGAQNDLTGTDDLLDGNDPGTGPVFGADEAATLVQGVDALTDAAAALAREGVFPLLNRILVESGRKGSGLYEVLDTRLAVAVYDFFGDSLDPPDDGSPDALGAMLASDARQNGSFFTVETVKSNDFGGLMIYVTLGAVVESFCCSDFDASFLSGFISENQKVISASGSYRASIGLVVEPGRDGAFHAVIDELEAGVTLLTGSGAGSTEEIQWTSSIDSTLLVDAGGRLSIDALGVLAADAAAF